MNWMKRNKEEILHHSMALVGGICAVYAILIRGGNFGAAQTSNLIALVLDFALQDIPSFFLRVLILLTYASSLIIAYLISMRYPHHKKYICLFIESICCILAGLIPGSFNPLLALCPIFVLSAFQWQIFTEPKNYNSSTLFSTNNLKQMLLSWTNYKMNGDLEQKKKAFFFIRTLLSFHTGILVGFFIVSSFGSKGIWFALFPMTVALLCTIAIEQAEAVTDILCHNTATIQQINTLNHQD